MSAEPVTRRKERNTYKVLFLPSDQSKKSATFSISKSGIFGIIIATFLLITCSVLALVIFTPIGTHLPIASPELERMYGQKVVEIQKKLTDLAIEVNNVQMYNLRLRKALGERMTNPDNEKESIKSSKESVRETKRNSAERFSKTSADDTKLFSESKQDLKPDSKKELISGQNVSAVQSSSSLQHVPESFPLTMPAIGFQTRGFDVESNHLGLDIAGKEGSPVVSAAAGVVIFSDWTADDGLMMVVLHGSGYTTVYKHNMSLLRNKGAVVKRGETIALLGNTGRTSTGPHLHFEVWNHAEALNPINYLITIQ